MVALCRPLELNAAPAVGTRSKRSTPYPQFQEGPAAEKTPDLAGGQWVSAVALSSLDCHVRAILAIVPLLAVSGMTVLVVPMSLYTKVEGAGSTVRQV